MSSDAMWKIVKLCCNRNPLLYQYFNLIRHNNYVAQQFEHCFYCGKQCCLAFMSPLCIPLDSSGRLITSRKFNPHLDISAHLGNACSNCSKTIREGGIFDAPSRL
jgi:hypothetical protein